MFSPTVVLEGVDKFLSEFEDMSPIAAGVASVGDAAAYALVWEFGNVRQEQPGPKTVQGTNPDGKTVWLSTQAPFGYVRVNEPYFWQVIEERMARIDYDQHNAASLTKAFERAATDIAKAMARQIRDTVPVDSGALQDSIRVVSPGDSMLDELDDNETTFELEG